MKDKTDVIHEFNEIVNMTASELEKWLKSDDSNSAGWPKEDENGETVGHDSGRKIVNILKANPKKDPKKYSDEQVGHMRKVVSYCKRHLAQEEKTNKEKSEEEVKKTKSYASLKNWGHDFLKAQGKAKSNGTREDGAEDATDGEEEEYEDEDQEDGAEDATEGEEEEDEDEDQEDGEDEEAQAGDKRKTRNGQSATRKKREVKKGEAGDDENEDEDDDEGEDEDSENAEESDKETDEANGEESGRKTRAKKTRANGRAKTQNGASNGQKQSNGQNGHQSDGGDEKKKTSKGSGSTNGPKKGDTVSWNWGGGQPKGKVLDVKAEDTTIETKRGNQVSRKGDSEDPAVVLDTGKSKAIKKSHELNET